MSDYSSVGPPQSQNFSTSAAFAAALQRAKQVRNIAIAKRWHQMHFNCIIRYNFKNASVAQTIWIHEYPR